MKKMYENPIIEVLELETVETANASPSTQLGNEGDVSMEDWLNGNN